MDAFPPFCSTSSGQPPEPAELVTKTCPGAGFGDVVVVPVVVPDDVVPVVVLAPMTAQVQGVWKSWDVTGDGAAARIKDLTSPIDLKSWDFSDLHSDLPYQYC